MRRFLMALFLFVLPLCAVPAVQAQTSPVSVQRFSLSGKVSALSVKGTALVAADAVAQIGISTSWQIRDDNILISLPTTSTSASTSSGPLGQIFMAGPQARLTFLNNALNKTAIGPKNGFYSYAFGEMGVARSNSNQTLAESVGVGLNWCSTSNPACVNVGEIAWVHGSIPNGVGTDGTPTYGNNAVRFSIGVSF